MRIVAAAFVVVCLATVAFAADPAPATPAGGQAAESAVKQQIKAFDATWAKHDGKAIAEYYTSDGDIVTADGNTFAGRDGIEQALSDAFNGQLKDSTLSTTVSKVRMLTPDVALVDADAQIKSGDADAQSMHLVIVMVKKEGKWLMATTRAIAPK